MKIPTLKVGTEIAWSGENHVVTAFRGGTLILRSRRGETSHVVLGTLVDDPDFRIVSGFSTGEDDYCVSFLDNVPKPALDKAKRLAAHLLEAVTGYRSGTAASALSHEPRPEYDPESTSMTQRLESKADELKVKRRWIFDLKRRLEEQGIYGLIDGRVTRIRSGSVDTRVRQAAEAVIEEIKDQSTLPVAQVIRLIAKKLKEDHAEATPSLPSQSTMRRLLTKLAQGKCTFGSSKSRRSIANRPGTPYSHFRANRPGEMVLIDSTPLDAYALEPSTFEWVRLQLTVAIDLYTRSILAWRFTPVSTKAVDAAMLLYDIIRPKLMLPGWPEHVRWAYVGVPENIILGEDGNEDSVPRLVSIPFLHPDSVLVDRGKIFLSQAFMNACSRLGTNVYLARPRTPTDKAQIERILRTIGESFVAALPSYCGPNLFSRGKNPEEQAFFFVDEIDAFFAEWVATYWQRRHHDGLQFSNVPDLHLSPNDMFEEGIARAGFVHLVPDERMYYELLPTEWRTVQHYGVDVRGLRYDGEILKDFRDQQSPHSGVHCGKWPIRYDPRDRSRMFFYDDVSERWHTLRWTGFSDEPRPFNEATVSFAKSLVIGRGGNPKNHEEMRLVLNDLLDRISDRVLVGRKERRLAAVNAIHVQQAESDRPESGLADIPADLVAEASDEVQEGLMDEDEEWWKKIRDLPLYRTADTALEDDDDDL